MVIMDDRQEEEKLRLNHAGLVARSTAGHAARGMKIKDQDDIWVSIQHHTFRNWVNVQLRDTGLKVEDLSEDLRDGVALVTLIEVLQKRKLRKVKKVMNQHQALENVTIALNAISDDGIKLVNIGNVDIVNGNLKLILGLVWSLIAHYQIGQSKFPPKKLMMSWLKAALPECHVSNFTSDWNSGIALSALIDHCQPGLFSNWKNLNPHNSTDNCKRAMEIAKREFNIPMVLEPEYLASPHLDDLSGMTYLSYFLKEGGPGYKSTLNWVRDTIPECDVKNFTTDWNDGTALSTLVRKLGGPVPGYKNLNTSPNSWENNLHIAQEGGKKLGVEPVLLPADMSKKDVEYLGPMAYIASYQWIPPREPASEAVRIKCNSENVRINHPVNFKVDYLANDVVRSEIKVYVSGPQGPVQTEVNLGPKGGKGSFTPTRVGFHEITVTYEEEVVEGCPVRVRVLPDINKVMMKGGLDPCALGSIVEVLINSNGTSGDGELDVQAHGPSGRYLKCPINNDEGVFTAMFQPDEAGEWSIAVTYDGQHIQGSPFHCHVYDPNAIKILNLDDGPKAPTGKPFTLLIDSAACGFGDVKCDVTLKGVSQPSKTLEVDQSLYELTFTPFEAARHKVYVYFNGHEVRGSPFSLYLGIEKPPERKSKARKVRSANNQKDVNDIIKEYATVRHKSGNDTLVKTYDSSVNKTNSFNDSYNSLNRSSEKVSSKSINDSYSSLNRSSEKVSSKSVSEKTSYEEKFPHVPRIISFDFPDCKTSFDVAKNANSTLERKKTSTPLTNGHTHSSLFNTSSSSSNGLKEVNNSTSTSSFTKKSSLFNSSTSNSTVMNSSTERSSLFKKESSPARINWSSMNDSRSSMSPPPRSPAYFKAASPPPPIRSSSPVDDVGEVGPNLSAPGRVSQISRVAPKSNEVDVEEFERNGVKVIRTKRTITEKTYRTHRTVEERTSSATSSPKLSPRSPISAIPPHSALSAQNSLNRPNSPFRTSSPFSNSRSSSPFGSQRTLVTSLKTTPSPASFKNPRSPVTKSVTTTVSSITDSNGDHYMPYRLSKRSSQSSFGSTSTLTTPPPLPTSPPPYYSTDAINENVSYSRKWRNSSHSPPRYSNGLNAPPLRSRLGSPRVEEDDSKLIRHSRLQTFLAPPSKSNSIQDINSINDLPNLTNSFSTNSLKQSKTYSSSTSNLLNDYDKMNSSVSTNRYYNKPSLTHSLANNTKYERSKHQYDAPRRPDRRIKADNINDTHRYKVVTNYRPEEKESKDYYSSTMTTSSKQYEQNIKRNHYGSSRDFRDGINGGPNNRDEYFTKASTRSFGDISYLPDPPPGFESSKIDASITSSESGCVDVTVSTPRDDMSPLSPLPSKVHHIVTTMEKGDEKESTDSVSNQEFDSRRRYFERQNNISIDSEESCNRNRHVSDMNAKNTLMSARNINSSSTGIRDSYDTKHSSKHKEQFLNKGKNYERSTEGFSAESKHYPSGDNRHVVQSKEYRYETKEYPVKTKFGDTQNRNSFSHKSIESDDKAGSIHNYENIDFVDSTSKTFESYHSKSYISNSLERPFIVLENENLAIKPRRSPFQIKGNSSGSSTTNITVNDEGYFTRKSSRKPVTVDASRVTVSGSAVRLVGVHESAEFFLSAPENLNVDDIYVEIIGPRKKEIPVQVYPGTEGELIAVFSPEEVGEHSVTVRVEDVHVPGSPFRCYVYDAQAIKVDEIPDGVVGQPVEFEIDGSSAGSGNLEILVNGGHVTSHVRNLGNQRFVASFVPHSSILHTIEMTFNEEKVPGSPWRMSVMESGGDGAGGPRVSVLGDSIKHFPSGQVSVFEIAAPGLRKEDVQVHIVSPAKRPVSHQIKESHHGMLQVSFTTSEVGSYVVEVTTAGQKVQGSPFIAKAYDAGLIRVSDVPNGVVGQPCQFRVDASQAGEGQLEISINDGEVPNHVQVLGGGRCLVSFTPDVAKTHTIDIKFNGETVRGCPFMCRVADTSRVSLTLRHLELVPVGRPSAFTISVDGGGSAELIVTLKTPSQSTLPVRVSGSVKTGFMAEFTPLEVGAHTIIVNSNDTAVSGTPFTCKVYDSSKVNVSHIPRGAIGKSLQFIVDASEAGEGNLEISISGHGRNIPTQVHPQGSARFAVSFIPLEAIDHIINISFNKESVAGSPFVAKVQADPNRIVVSGQNLAATAVGKPSFFTIANVTGSVEDVEINVEGPNGLPVSAQVQDKGNQTFKVEFNPKVAGEHKINVSYMGESIPGSPFSCKVYDVSAIKVRPTERGMVGKPATFLVETYNAGPGNLEVTVNNGQVPTSAQAQGNHEYAISFNPKEARPHVVELRFNGENVPGSPFTCEIVDVSRVTVAGTGLEKVPVDKIATFTVDAKASVDQLGVLILSPTRQPVSSKVVQNAEGKLDVLYTPREVGDHSVEVRVAEVIVPGSPFLVKSFDSSKVKVTEVTNGVVSKPVYFSIDASQAGAGNLEIIVSVNNRNVPNYVQSEGHARFRVNFKPKEAAVHTLSVKFNGEPVPGSPFKCRVTDSSQVAITGNGLKMSSLAKAANIAIDPRGAEIGECLIQVTSPSGVRVPVKLLGEFPKKVDAEFQPMEVGPHSVNILLDGEPVAGSPFTCNIYDVTRVQVSGLDNTKVNRPVTFTVDASQAGEGTLELVVTTAKASVRAEVAAKSRGLYDVTFTPHEAIPHFVNITFNEEDVIGSPFKCDVKDLEPREIRNIHRKESQMVTAKGGGLQKVVTNSLASFVVDTKGIDGDLDIRVTGPDGGQIPARLIRMKNGQHKAEYKPEQVGPYNVTVLHNGSPIATSPFAVEASDPRKVVVEASGECLAGKECALRVDAAEAGRGALSVGVKAAGQDVKHSIRDLGAGIYQVLFYPKAPVPHKVDVRYNGVPVRTSSFELPVRNPATGHEVTATGLGLHQARVNKSTSFVIETMNQNSKDFDVLISGPREWAVPVKCYQQKDGNLLAEYTPHTPGTYKIEVLCTNTHVRGSPFVCTAYDVNKVVIEKSKTSVAVGDSCKVRLDTTSAGSADIEAFVQSPNGTVEPVEINIGHDSEKILEWEPQDPGQYKIIILYGGEEVPGSPLTVDVGETGLASVSGAGLHRGSVDAMQHFVIDGRGLTGEPQVWVDGPDSVARVMIKKLEEGMSQVTYVPHEVGIFDVRVHWNNREVAGSPFHPKIIDTGRVRLIGGWSDLQDKDGKLELIPKQEMRLAFDVSEAGPGRLKAFLVHDMDDKEIECHVEQMGNRARVAFTPQSSGHYKLKLLYNDIPLPDSPVVGYAPSSVGSDHTRVTLRGHGLTTARCGENAEFIIDGSDAGPGTPDVTMSGTKADVTVDIKADGGGIWRATYNPRLPGAYLLNVMWSDRQVKGCPLKIQVDGSADATRVVCSGDGLRHGMVGQDIKSFIDTRRAGPGELTARCNGPTKMAMCELYDHRDGTFTLNIRPQESGRHSLIMQYENEHVPGSPYTIKVAGAPDPSKVKVYGPGIEHGVLATYQSRFICDTRGAGAGQLTVRIRGPKGAFRVEMQRESQKDRTILCKYDPTEPGDYRVEVKWSGEHVPGSPFMIMIFDAQDELNRYMSGEYSPTGPGHNDYYGSIGYGTATYGGAVSIGGGTSWRGSQPQI